MEMRLFESIDIYVETVHKGQVLRWSTVPQVFKPEVDVFKHINQYWSTLPVQTQDQIFEVFERIHKTYNDIWDQDRLMIALRPLVAELFYLHPQESIQFWVNLKSDILVPPSVKTRFDVNEGMIGTRERTYLVDDYKKLIALAISMRLMIPVWGEFINRGRKEFGTIYKEYQAYQLLAHSPVIDCEAMERLRTFIEHTIPKDHPIDGAIINAISREDFPVWVTSITVVRRLCYADVSGIDRDGSSLVTYLYNFIDNKVKTIDSQMGKIMDKTSSETSSDGENNLSKLEGFKVKQTVTSGDICSIQVFIEQAIGYAIKQSQTQVKLEKPNCLLSRMCEDEDFPTLVENSFTAAITSLQNDKLTVPQVSLAGWVLSSLIPVRSLPYLSKIDVISMMAISQAYLWKNDYKDLAVLVTASPKESHNHGMHTITDARLLVSKPTREEFSTYFPYMRRTSSRAKNIRPINLVTNSIDDISEQFSRYSWISNIPVSWTTDREIQNRSRFLIPSNIREQLTKLVISLEDKLLKETTI